MEKMNVAIFDDNKKMLEVINDIVKSDDNMELYFMVKPFNPEQMKSRMLNFQMSADQTLIEVPEVKKNVEISTTSPSARTTNTPAPSTARDSTGTPRNCRWCATAAITTPKYFWPTTPPPFAPRTAS
jgi:hypothetical protein